MAKKQGNIILAAGGTGGHLFPAEALAVELEKRGFDVYLFTDGRARPLVSHFVKSRIHVIPSATIKSKNPLSLMQTFRQLWSGVRRSRQLYQQLKPLLVAGFGGYPSLPPLYSAIRFKIPTLIHEQNAVMGRANRLLSRRVTAIAGGFLKKKALYADKMTITGNPLRPAMMEVVENPYHPPEAGDTFRLLVFGGSQGASFFSTIVPQALRLMSPQVRARLKISQQARPVDLADLQQACKDLQIDTEIAPFFTHMAELMTKAHFIIARAGASTVAEIAAIGRPALLVPYPGALDHDQAANACALADAGGVMVMSEHDLSAEWLSILLCQMMDDKQTLQTMAAKAKKFARPQATRELADLVEKLIHQRATGKAGSI